MTIFFIFFGGGGGDNFYGLFFKIKYSNLYSLLKCIITHATIVN